jgi:hypothetical protein
MNMDISTKSQEEIDILQGIKNSFIDLNGYLKGKHKFQKVKDRRAVWHQWAEEVKKEESKENTDV